METKGKILLVDDSHTNLSFIASLLLEVGYEVYPADSGSIALRSIERRKPDLVLLDIQMPGMNGFEVCRRIKENPEYQDIPVIFLTVSNDKEERLNGLRIGAVDYVVKPFEKEELIARVNNHIELYNYHRLFAERSAHQLIEKESELQTQNLLYKQLNETLKQANSQLQEAKEHAEQCDRAKSLFLANISHEIRTPMNGILGFTELLKNENLDQETQIRYIDIIQKSGQRMLTLINDLIDISRIEAGLIELFSETTDISQLLDEQIAFFSIEAAKRKIKLSVTNNLEKQQNLVEIDRIKLGQILSNLIKNALKFTPNGSIYVCCRMISNELYFSVTDTGIGIDAQHIDKIFNRFDQGELSSTKIKEGSGLGLAITKAYIELMGGKIGVESKLGEGSRFYFTLPYNATTIAQTLNSLDNNNCPHLPITILIIEDEDVCFLFLKELLEASSAKLHRACNGWEAILFCENNPMPDIILLDIKMPVMDGFDTCRKIRKLHPTVPIIAQSAFANQQDITNATAAGCNDYITKPIDKKMLFRKLLHYTIKQQD